MPYTMNDFRKEVAREVLDELTPEERVAGLRPEERVAGLRPEDLLAALRPEEIEAYLQKLRKTPNRGRAKKHKPKR